MTQPAIYKVASRNVSSVWCQYSKHQSHNCVSNARKILEALYRAVTTKAFFSPDNMVNPPESPNPAPIPEGLHASQVPAIEMLNADITQDKAKSTLQGRTRNKALVLMALGQITSWTHPMIERMTERIQQHLEGVVGSSLEDLYPAPKQEFSPSLVHWCY